MRVRFIFVLLLSFSMLGTLGGHAQAQTPAAAAPSNATSGEASEIDGIAARIEDDIITESEVRELSAFQELVDGKPKPRMEVIRELADQWLIRGEANAAKFPRPATEQVDRAYEQFVKQFPSPEEFEKRFRAAGLTEAGIRRILEEQLYLSRFLDYRFRPAAQVDDKQVQAYYDTEFAPQLKARGDAVPPLEDVEETIREVLIQRAINDRATKWLDETRGQLKLDIVGEGS
jgi:hypothetical protein